MNGVRPLGVWIADSRVGELALEGRRQHIFSYTPRAADAVSLTMPVRLQSWASDELHPIFQMNLPEGALLETIRRAIAKIVGDDDYSILLATGGSQVGKNRFAAVDKEPETQRTSESLDDILTYPDTRELFHELLERYALRSGVSGVQPKVLLDAQEPGTLSTAGYIVKSWGTDYPQLAANEYFCMTAAKKAGLPVPEFHLAENGGLFVMRRFDMDDRGVALGFEDMCSLQALGTAQKYRSTYERVAKSLRSFISGEEQASARRQFFAMLVLSSMVRNGDAHLKNFGVLYSSPPSSITMAPVYDVVTTTAYIRHDVPALSLAGTKKWWPRKMLESFAITHLSLSVGDIAQLIDRTAEAVLETRRLIPVYAGDHPEFEATGDAMLAAWDAGIRDFR